MAEAYDAVRPGYPESLVELACALGGLEPGSRVLEIGCGTGKLTEALVERGLLVDAVDPGPNMIALARKRTGHSDAVAFHVGRFEDVALPEEAFAAAFSATAFHWVDPSVGWAKAARALRPGGLLALLMHIGYHEDETVAASEALRKVLKQHLPDGGTWQPLRDLATLRAGAEERSANVSAVWTWLGHHDLTRPEAAALFDDARLATHPLFREQTADELWARLATSSSYQRLGPEARAALEHDIRATVAGLGGTVRESVLAVLVDSQHVVARSTAPLDRSLSPYPGARWVTAARVEAGKKRPADVIRLASRGERLSLQVSAGTSRPTAGEACHPVERSQVVAGQVRRCRHGSPRGFRHSPRRHREPG